MNNRSSFLLVIVSLIILSLFTTTYSASSEKVQKRDPVDNLTRSEDSVYENGVFKKKPLHYYHKYLKDMGNGKKQVPLPEHYANERKLRKEHYNYVNQISKLKEQRLFRENDVKHAILKLKNDKVKLEERWKNTELRSAQRTTSIKYQMDHDFAFATYFESRKKVNLGKLKTALPDLVDSLKRMVAFDNKNYAKYYNSTVEQYMILKEIEREDKAKDFKFADEIDELADKILDLQVKVTKVNLEFERKIKNIQVQDDAVEKALSKDEVLDHKRLMNEQIEQETVLNEPINPLPKPHGPPPKVKSLGIGGKTKAPSATPKSGNGSKIDEMAKKNHYYGPLNMMSQEHHVHTKNSRKVVGLSETEI